MDYLISGQAAQAAIDIFCRWLSVDGYSEGERNIIKAAIYEIENLPSAQTEKQHGRIFQGIVVEYPSNNPYPDYKGKPYFSIKYTENGQEFIGYGTYNPEVLSEYLKEYFMPSAQQWIPVSEKLPEKYGWYQVTLKDGRVSRLYYDYKGDRWIDNVRKHIFELYDIYSKITHKRITEEKEDVYWDDWVVAWMPLPEPWKGDSDETD